MSSIWQNVVAAASSILCAAICWRSGLEFGGTEFGSGSLAGNQGTSSLMFLMAATLIWKYPRFASGTCLIACYLSLPLYLYLLFPRPFRELWPGEWSTLELPRERFVWNAWWAIGVVASLVAISICCRVLIPSLRRQGAGVFRRLAAKYSR